MHISDGILPVEIAVVSAAVSAGLIYYGVKKIESQDIPMVAGMSALFFVASFIHIPLGPTQFHLVLIGIIGLILGWYSFLAISIALILQAFLLGYGGITSIGANSLIMGLPAIIVYKIYQTNFLKRQKEGIRYFSVGFLGVFFASIFLSFVLLISGKEYFYTASLSLIMNIPAMILEGFITIFLALFLKRSIPKFREML